MLNTTCQGHGGRCECRYDEYSECVHYSMEIDLGVVSYCDGTCSGALDLLERDIETGREGCPEETTGTITLRVGGHGRTPESYVVTFEGASAEEWALSYIAARPSFYFSELLYRPVSHAAFPRLVDALYPTCEHGMALELCNGPDHFLSRDQEMALWG